MPTTTIRLPEDLKARIASAAEHAGATPHAFILQAIKEKTEAAERRAAFDEIAERRYADIIANGETIPWEAMRDYLDSRLTGKKTSRPKARKLGG